MFRKSKVPKEKRPSAKRPSDRGDIPKKKIKKTSIDVVVPPKRKIGKIQSKSPTKSGKNDKRKKNIKSKTPDKIRIKSPGKSKLIPKSRIIDMKISNKEKGTGIPRKTPAKISVSPVKSKVPKKERIIHPSTDVMRDLDNPKNKKLSKTQSKSRPSLRKDKVLEKSKKSNKKLNKPIKKPSKRDDLKEMKSLRDIKLMKREKEEKDNRVPEARHVELREKTPRENKSKLPTEKKPKDSIEYKKPRQKRPK